MGDKRFDKRAEKADFRGQTGWNSWFSRPHGLKKPIFDAKRTEKANFRGQMGWTIFEAKPVENADFHEQGDRVN